jgi:hypothetical protein
MEPMKPMRPMEAPQRWWPAEWGSPSASGGQNEMRYAFFSQKHRLIVELKDGTTMYETGDHKITGVSQADAKSPSLEFTSQHGRMLLAELAVAD